MKNFQLVIKRIFDLCASLTILVVGLPFLLLIGLFVKIASPGPVFFIQSRVGKNGKIYRMIKFRTMTGMPDSQAMRWTLKDEQRIFRGGHFLRDFGLDELPQLLNIIKGDMSIVGPRPPLPQQVNAFPARLKKMFTMRPGVLSLAVIAGRRTLTLEERYDLHVQYVKTWSLKLDFKILWRSLFVVLRREGASEKSKGG